MDLCKACRKMIYRTDDCKGVGLACGRTDGGRKNPCGGSSAVEPRISNPVVEGSTPSPRSTRSGPNRKAEGAGSIPVRSGGGVPNKPPKESTAAPKALARPSRGQALSQDSVGALSPSGPVDRKTAAKAAKKSTAARMDVPGKTTVRDALAHIASGGETNLGATGDSIRKRVPEVNSPAGTQTPPVDTLPKRRGRPRTIADMRAYKAEKERQRRAKARAGSVDKNS